MEKYLHYKALDFAEDPDFIAWVQGGFSDENEVWRSLQSKSIDLKQEIDEAIDIVSIFQIKEKEVYSQDKRDALFERIKESNQDTKVVDLPNKGTGKTSILRYLVPLAAAAAIAFLVIFFIPQSDISTIANADSTKKEYLLPDKSVIVLDKNAMLSFVEDDFTKKRTVKLEGQAFFKVQKGTPFVVETENGIVEVLGTTFNVNTLDGLKVQCVTGKVRVVAQNKSVILTHGEKTHYLNNTLTKSGSSQDDLKWMVSKYSFQSETLKNVIQELEKEYQVKIIADADIMNLSYTGFFESGNLENALQALTWPMSLRYDINGETITISK